MDWDTLGYHLIMPKNLPQRGMWWTLTLPYELLGEAVSTLAGSRAHDVATPQKKRKEKKPNFDPNPKLLATLINFKNNLGGLHEGVGERAPISIHIETPPLKVCRKRVSIRPCG